MDKDPFDDQLDSALRELRNGDVGHELRDFERGVWAEVALHDETRWAKIMQWIRGGITPVPRIAAFSCAIAAIAIGVTSAMFQTRAYGEALTESMEQRYVASIHPVLRSVEHNRENPEP